MKRVDGEPARKLRLGITAVLGASRDPLAMAYLRETFDNEPDRRVPIAMALAQQPDGENWPLLVRSLSIVEGMAAQEILLKLAEVDRMPEDPEAYRQVIIRGLMLRENGGREASALLEKWTGQQPAEPGATWDVAMAAWQAWFVADLSRSARAATSQGAGTKPLDLSRTAQLSDRSAACRGQCQPRGGGLRKGAMRQMPPLRPAGRQRSAPT